MSPIDDTPHAGEIMQPPQRRIPHPLPGQASDQPLHGKVHADELQQAEVAQRPPLPSHRQRSAAAAPGQAAEPLVQKRRARGEDRPKSLKYQRG